MFILHRNGSPTQAVTIDLTDERNSSVLVAVRSIGRQMEQARKNAGFSHAYGSRYLGKSIYLGEARFEHAVDAVDFDLSSGHSPRVSLTSRDPRRGSVTVGLDDLESVLRGFESCSTCGVGAQGHCTLCETGVHAPALPEHAQREAA